MTAVGTTPEPVDKPRRGGAFDSRRARVAGYARVANMTPEELSAAASHAAKARWDKVRAERVAAGLPSTKATEPLLSAAALEVWLAEVDKAYPDVEFTAEGRKRKAQILARQAAAKAELGLHDCEQRAE